MRIWNQAMISFLQIFKINNYISSIQGQSGALASRRVCGQSPRYIASLIQEIKPTTFQIYIISYVITFSGSSELSKPDPPTKLSAEPNTWGASGSENAIFTSSRSFSDTPILS